MMRKLALIFSVGVVLASCSSREVEKGMTENEAKAKIDSLVGVRLNDLMMQSSEDLDRRMSIEVKPKADSIFNAWKAANGQ